MRIEKNLPEKKSVSDNWKKNIFPLSAKKFSVQTEENFLGLAPRSKKQLKNQPEKKAVENQPEKKKQGKNQPEKKKQMHLNQKGFESFEKWTN